MKPEFKYKAKCVYVVDGDTADFDVDLGFNVVIKIRVRLARINCPERRKATMAEWKLAKGHLAQLILGETVILETQKTGKYGRWLGEVWTSEGNVNDDMVQQGLAVYKEY